MTILRERPNRVLIVSSHPLFRDGLHKLLTEPRGLQLVGAVVTSEDAAAALETLKPDLVVVDYDDRAVDRREVLARFVEGESPMQVVLVSLQESGQIVVYDRRTLTPAQIEDWLEQVIGPSLPSPCRRGAGGEVIFQEKPLCHGSKD